ncbi:oxidoreductase [Sphingobium sp. C100]|jgi:2-polyprenyl-6-methoxyphenol hydroxylase-like FAD-dependent oxidoreductase|uniref:FAD-dependent monooxygenase n=1 Tax=Sphingobium sp. C100 TaxID=1207055 RepID=UPI0003D5CD5F|nr:FAD-dependent monooxygenase [Sphingobium sp. C100]ETI62635.1 oxidoreductase [Sphingobium sp. C100]
MISGKRILIVGGGIGGMAAAIRFAELGSKVTLIDIDPEWRVYGAGITITGPTLRAYRRLGLLDAIKEQGAIAKGSTIFRYDGLRLHELDEPALEEGLPATGGIMRPKLHRIMQARVKALDIEVRLGLSVSALDNQHDGVDVAFTDGARERFDLVVGADSIYSGVRRIAFPHMGEAQPTGQGCWRLSIKRPPTLESGEIYLGHQYPAGINRCAQNMVYLWMLTPHERREQHFTDEELFVRLQENLADFGGNIAWVRENMTRDDWINYRPLAAVLQPTPWYMGQIVLLGDAVHATTPHMASGAGMAVESALVLADELDKADTIIAGLAAYQARRFERCRHVVETSVKVGEMQLAGEPPEVVGGALGAGLHRLAGEY